MGTMDNKTDSKDKGNTARQMAATPVVEAPTQPVNRFVALFGSRVFKASIGETRAYENGTKNTRLAEVILELGKTESYLRGTVNLMEPPNGDVKMEFRLASTGGTFRSSILTPDTDGAKADLAAWKDTIVQEYIAWHEAQPIENHIRAAKTTGVVIADASKYLPRLVKAPTTTPTAAPTAPTA